MGMEDGWRPRGIPPQPDLPKGRCKMFQTVFTNKKRGFSQEVTPTTEFMRQYDGMCRDYPLMVYPTDMGIKQAIPDSMAGVTDEAVFCAKILKKADAVWAGTVRVASGGEREPIKSPVEREVWKIAAADLAEIFEKKKVPKDRQAQYIRLKVERDWDELAEKAKVNLAKVEAIKPDAFAALDELYAEAAAEAEVEAPIEAEVIETDPVEVVEEPAPRRARK